MASEAKKKRGPRRRIAEPVFISKTEIAQHLGLGDLDTLDSWVGKGRIPPPHSSPGERYSVWLRRHWQVYVDTGEWPSEAWSWRGVP